MISKLNYIFNGKDKLKLFILLILIITGSFLEMAAVAVFQPFTEAMIMPDAIYDKELLKFIYAWFSCTSLAHFLTVMSIVIIVIYVVKNVFIWLQQYYIMNFSFGMQTKISVRLMTAYMKEPYTFHLSKNVAVLQRSLQEDTSLFSQLLIHAMSLLGEIAVCIALGITLYTVSNSMAVIVGVMLIGCVILFIQLSRRYTKVLGQKAQLYKAKIYQWVNQSLGGIKEVKVLNRERFFIESFQKYYKLYVKGVKFHRLISITPKYFVEAVCMVGLLLAIIIKLNFGRSDIASFLPQLAVFAVAAFRLLPSVSRINEHVNNIVFALPSLELIYHDLKNIENHGEDQAKADEKGMDWQFEHALAARHVTYAYPETDTNVLEDAQCVIPKGKTVAFIGSSGAGKTTMADIILGLLKPQLGKVMADGLNIHKNLSLWHRQIGYIPQTIYLSDDTIRNNVAFGIMPDEIDDEAVTEALRKAQLSDFVDVLPDGLDTFVGDRGVRLSGGQRQRIGIARALYHDPEILVLDEATSALDSETEAAVMESIENLQGLKTMIIIAHRLTTIQKADIIYEVTDGKMVEVQNHKRVD